MEYATQMSRVLAILFVLFSSSLSPVLYVQASNFAVITNDNVSDLKLQAIIPGRCGPIVEHDHLMLTRINQVSIAAYEIATGELRYQIEAPLAQDAILSPDRSLLALEGTDTTVAGIYEVSTGRRLLQVVGEDMAFSPDSSLVVVTQDGLYEIETGERRFTLPNLSYRATFSPDGTLLVADLDVFDVQTGDFQYRLPLDPRSGELPVITFSPDSSSFLSSFDALYDAATGERRFSIFRYTGVFSPDSSLLVLSEDGLYDVKTGDQRFKVEGDSPLFSPDGAFLVTGTSISNRQGSVYEVQTGTEEFSFYDEGQFFISPDSLLLATAAGMYELPTGRYLYPIPYRPRYPGFSNDGSLFAAIGGLYSSTTGTNRFAVLPPLIAPEVNWTKAIFSDFDRLTSLYDDVSAFSPYNTIFVAEIWNSGHVRDCVLFTVSPNPARGIIDIPIDINIRSAPNLSAAVTMTTTEELQTVVVLAKGGSDGGWYCIGIEEWVSAEVVQPIFIPVNLPVE
jgi:WD40 repeat protein